MIAFSLAFVVKLVEWPGKWGMVLFEAIERGDIKCSQIYGAPEVPFKYSGYICLIAFNFFSCHQFLVVT